MSRFKNWLSPYFDEQNYAWNRIESSIFGQKYEKGNICYGWRCLYPENLILGYGCDIGCFTLIQAQHGVEIGEDVQISSHCSIYSSNTENKTQGKVVIGKGSLIGSHCLILPGVVIKPYSKIKAFSVVEE